MLAHMRIFPGVNIHASRPVIRMTLQLDGLADLAPTQIPSGYVRTLEEWFPNLTLEGPVREISETGGNVLAQTMLSVVKAYQTAAGFEHDIGEIHDTAEPGTCEVISAFDDRNVTLAAVRLAWLLVKNLSAEYIAGAKHPKEQFNFEETYLEFSQTANKQGLSAERRALVAVAEARDIPWRKTEIGAFSFGQGKYQRVITQNFSDRTGFVAVKTTTNKLLTNRILREHGLPVARQILVLNEQQAVRAATEIQYPVVIKPRDTDYGQGVSVDLRSEHTVREAYKFAAQYNCPTLVEEFIPGDTHRLGVVNGKVVTVRKYSGANVVGDGRATVKELVATENDARKRDKTAILTLSMLKLDGEADRILENQGMSINTVPAAGQQVRLRGNANVSTGGRIFQLTDDVNPDIPAAIHRDVERIAILAAKVIGLDIAGVDYLTPDITKSYHDVGGAICEVNCNPAAPNPIAILDYLFPDKAPARISSATIVGDEEAKAATVMLDDVMRVNGFMVGRATQDKRFLNGELIEPSPDTIAGTIPLTFDSKIVDMAIVQATAAHIAAEGLSFDRCDVTAIRSDVQAELDTRTGVETREISRAFYAMLAATGKAIILAEGNPLYDLEAVGFVGKTIYLISIKPMSEEITKHLMTGNPVVQLQLLGEEKAIMLCVGSDREIIAQLTELFPAPMRLDGIGSSETLLNLLFVVAIAHALGQNPDQIRAGLKQINLPKEEMF